MHRFMDIMAGNQRRRALLGSDEIDQEERKNSSECGPRENLAEWDWNRPGCRSMDKASHVLPYRVSHLRAPLGKGARASPARMPESCTLLAAELPVNAGREPGRRLRANGRRRGRPAAAPGGRKAIALHERSRRTIRTIYLASGFRVPIVKALAGLRGHGLRERGIDAIKIAPMSGAAATNSPKRATDRVAYGGRSARRRRGIEHGRPRRHPVCGSRSPSSENATTRCRPSNRGSPSFRLPGEGGAAISEAGRWPRIGITGRYCPKLGDVPALDRRFGS